MTKYSQIDSRWGGSHLGSSNTTIHAAGCKVTAVCNGVNAICGTDWTPGQLASNAAIFDPETDGTLDLLDDAKAAAFIKVIKSDGRDFIEDDARIDQYLKDPNKFVIWNVNDGRHFVLGWKKDIFGKYWALDSWDGTIVDVKKKYKNIVSSRYYSKA